MLPAVWGSAGECCIGPILLSYQAIEGLQGDVQSSHAWSHLELMCTKNGTLTALWIWCYLLFRMMRTENGGMIALSTLVTQMWGWCVYGAVVYWAKLRLHHWNGFDLYSEMMCAGNRTLTAPLNGCDFFVGLMWTEKSQLSLHRWIGVNWTFGVDVHWQKKIHQIVKTLEPITERMRIESEDARGSWWIWKKKNIERVGRS